MQTEIKPTEEVPVGIDSDGNGWSNGKEREMNTNPYSVDSNAVGLKYPEDPNPTMPEKNSRIRSPIRNHRAFGSNISYEVEEIMSGEIPQILGTIDKKLEELLFLKHDLDKLNE